MAKPQKNYLEDLANGLYDFPAEDRGFLQNLFVTVAGLAGEKRIRVHITEKNQYKKITEKYRLRGIKVQKEVTGNWHYRYIAVIRPSVLLAAMDRFRRPPGPAEEKKCA